MFGEAVDLDYLPHSAEKWETLWQAADKPKILEKTGGVPMIKIRTDGTEWRSDDYPANIYSLEDIFNRGYCLHLGE